VTPRVSVVMPAYNAASTVGAAVSSVLRQTYPQLELVLVDDGSGDATSAIAAAHEGPVRIVRQENRGVAAARNRGIAEARGELIAFCDADDVLFDEHVSALVDAYDAHAGKRLATANSYWLFPAGVDPSKVRYRGRFPDPARQRLAILEQNFVSTMSLFPRSLVDEIGPFDVGRRRAEDWDFWLRAVFAGYEVVLQRRPLALYRWGATGLSSAYEQMDEDVVEILRQVAARDDLREDEHAYLDRRLAGPEPRVLTRRGDEALRAGRYREAASLLRQAARLVPSERPLVWKSRALALLPPLTGPVLRARQRRIESTVGLDRRHAR
jgi:glycosyltransferase involved in cell wall biosynthesis